MKRVLLVVISFAALFALFRPGKSVHQPAGILAPDAPLQRDTTSDVITLGDYQLTPLAEFSLRARVLSRESYRLGRESDLSPIDLALGWGHMSDSGILANFTITQSNRWYYWNTPDLPIPRQQVVRESANMHVIPADPSIERELKKTRKGHLIELEGFLVRVEASDGWTWKSSLKRNDSGDGSCELVYVRSFTILQ